jgi:hypothetical protein
MSASKNLIQAAAGVGGGDFYSYTIDNSARFDGSSYLYRTAGTATDARKGAISFWVKRGSLSVSQYPLIFWNGSNVGYVELRGDNAITFQDNGNSALLGTYLKRVFRDTSAWYHFLLILDSTNPVANDREKLYINGVRETDFTSGWQGTTTLNGTYNILSATAANDAKIGYTSSSFNGYLAQVAIVDGTVYSETDFGEFKNGVWIPKDISGLTFGNNGFYLDFGNSGALGTDSSGNGNNFTPSGFLSSDQMIDTPTNNFATLNPLINPTGLDSTFYEGNLAMQTNTAANSNGTNTTQSSIAIPSSGKWFFEFRPRSYGGQFNVFNAIGGIAPSYETINDAGWKYGIEYYGNGNKYINNVSTSYGASWTVGDVIGVLVDADNVSVTFYKNGTSQGEITSATHGFSNFDGWHFTLEDAASTEYVYYDANFGQNGTFNGNVTAGGNSDANGIGDFKYTVPTDALALCTANLQEPTIGPNSATLSDEYFNTVLWTGNGSTQSVTGVNFQPDWVWLKSRSTAQNHYSIDAVRGINSILVQNDTYPESTFDATWRGLYGNLTSFDADGFTVVDGTDPTYNSFNGSGDTYVAWNWKANGSGVSNTDGATASTVSVNTDAGFSIVTYTGTGSVTTIGHGLGVAPEFIIVRARDQSTGYNWSTYSSMLGPTYNTGALDNANAADASYNYWANTAPTSSVFTVSTFGAVNDNGGRMLAYCFAEVEGFNSFGKYTGNGSSDGPFIYTGFRPAFVIMKRTDGAGSWHVFDNKRSGYNYANDVLQAHDSAAELSGQTYEFADLLSNGFKVRRATYGPNVSGGTYIYMAFAENPFKYSNAR